MSIEGPIRTVQDGLVFHLDAANNKSYPGSGTSWRDLSISNNTGTLSGPAFNISNNGGLVFDGIDDYLVFANNTGITRDQSKSFSAWIYPTAIDGSGFYDRVLMHKPNDTDHFVFAITGFGVSANNFRLAGTPNNNITIGFSSNQYPINNWYYVVFTWNGTTFLSYCNTVVGAMATDPNGAYGLGGADRAVYLAGRLGQTETFFKGTIAQATLYNFALTPSQILQNYNAAKSRFGL